VSDWWIKEVNGAALALNNGIWRHVRRGRSHVRRG